MARRIRLYGKKRGARRTGSKRLGSYGEALFFAVLFCTGIVGFYVLLAQMILPEWQANRRYVEHEGVILDKRVHWDPPEARTGLTRYRPEVRITYQVGGKTYSTWTYGIRDNASMTKEAAEAVIKPIEIGAVYRCWYNPDDPDEAVLVRGYNWWLWLLLVLPASFVIIGAVGTVLALLQTGASAERRAALARKAADLDLFDDAQQRGVDYPNIPLVGQITNSPGTKLAYRLPADATAGWTLTGIILVCLLWNGIVGSFAVGNVHGHFVGQGDWLMSLFLAPFFLVGCGLIYFTIRQMLLTTGVGGARMEISGHPLYPGESYELFLSQTGDLRVHQLRVLLVCEEEATFRLGTDTRIERVRVYEQCIYQRDDFEIAPGLSVEHDCTILVPESAMHSFHSGHNEIRWQLVVAGSAERWPDFERRFPVVVYPPRGEHVPA